MSTVIRAHVMPEALRTVAQNLASGSSGKVAEGLGFFDLAMREAGNKAESNGFETSRMSLAQYKQYLSGRISAIEINPTRILDSYSVRISEEGFAAMQADPEYEAWVLGRLAAEWSTPKETGAGGVYTTYSVGADAGSFCVNTVDPAECQKELDELDRAQESFWERRHRRHEEYMELAERERFLRRLRSGSVSSTEYLLSGLG